MCADLKNRVGETREMNCGMKATIISYNRVDNIDIVFEDSTIVYHKTYSSFIRGAINNPNISKRIGETRKMKCGMLATIIAYHNARDIDIKFENGVVVEHKKYDNFKKGNITTKIKINRIDEKRKMKCGMFATIIKYNNSDDITVQFEDGTIVEHRTYYQYKNKNITPRVISYKARKQKCRIGETRKMNSGMTATIIAYHNCKDIDIQFEDGTIIRHRQYISFKNGNITNHNRRIGETKKMKNGMKATIIAYRKSDDIDVQFEDGTIVKHKSYQHFTQGHIRNTNFKYKTFVVHNYIKDGYYYVTDMNGEDFILTYEEMDEKSKIS